MKALSQPKQRRLLRCFIREAHSVRTSTPALEATCSHCLKRKFQTNTTYARRVVSAFKQIKKRPKHNKVSSNKIARAIDYYIGWVHKEGRPLL